MGAFTIEFPKYIVPDAISISSSVRRLIKAFKHKLEDFSIKKPFHVPFINSLHTRAGLFNEVYA